MKKIVFVFSVSLVACGGGNVSVEESQETDQQEHSPGAHVSAKDASSTSSHAHHTKHHKFVDAKAWSKMFDDPERDAWQKPDAVVTALDIKPGMTVADIGAGTGYFEGRLDAAVGPEGKVLALDIEPQMAEFMEARAAKDGWKNVEARVIRAHDPGLEGSSVDRILIVDTWHHIEERLAYAGRLHRALKPGGFVLIVDFNATSPHGPPANMRIAPGMVATEFLQAGFSVAEPAGDTSTLPNQYLVRAERSAKLVGIPGALLYAGTLFGGQPSIGHIREMKAAGYQQVVSLRTPSEPGFAEEKAAVEKLGMRFISIPVEGAAGLTKTKAQALFMLLKNETPTVVHCGSGNRAGALMGLAARCVGAGIEQSLKIADHAGVTKLRSGLEARLRAGVCAPAVAK